MTKWWIAGAVVLCLACSEEEGVVAPSTAPDAGRRFVEGERSDERPTGEVTSPSHESAESGPEVSPAPEPAPAGDPASPPHRTAASPDEPEGVLAPPAGID
jgi:hypothetical protein